MDLTILSHLVYMIKVQHLGLLWWNEHGEWWRLFCMLAVGYCYSWMQIILSMISHHIQRMVKRNGKLCGAVLSTCLKCLTNTVFSLDGFYPLWGSAALYTIFSYKNGCCGRLMFTSLFLWETFNYIHYHITPQTVIFVLKLISFYNILVKKNQSNLFKYAWILCMLIIHACAKFIDIISLLIMH